MIQISIKVSTRVHLPQTLGTDLRKVASTFQRVYDIDEKRSGDLMPQRAGFNDYTLAELASHRQTI